jgi:hypothetical protein
MQTHSAASALRKQTSQIQGVNEQLSLKAFDTELVIPANLRRLQSVLDEPQADRITRP